jgi:hypothetical protein
MPHTKVQTCLFNLAKNAAQSMWATIEKNLSVCAVSTYYYNLLKSHSQNKHQYRKCKWDLYNNCSAPIFLSSCNIQDKLCLLFDVCEQVKNDGVNTRGSQI